MESLKEEIRMKSTIENEETQKNQQDFPPNSESNITIKEEWDKNL